MSSVRLHRFRLRNIAGLTWAIVAFSGVADANAAKLRKVRPMGDSGIAVDGSIASQVENGEKPGNRSRADNVGKVPDSTRAGAKQVSGESVAASRKTRLPLSRFVDGESVIRLLGKDAEWRLSIPVNPRMRVTSGSVELSFVPSISMVAERSPLTLHWNGQRLKQEEPAPQSAGGATGRVTAELRGDATVSAENELWIKAVHTDLAEDGETGKAIPSAVLWTEIDLEASWIEFSYGCRVPDVQADEFPSLAGGRPWLDSRLAIVTPGLGDGNDDYLQWGGWMAQWIARAGGMAPLEFTHGTVLAGIDADAVVIGTRSELPNLLPAGVPENAGEDGVSLFFHPENPRYLVLLLSGANREALRQNVLRFVEDRTVGETGSAAVRLASRSPLAFVRELAMKGRGGVETDESPGFALHVASRDSETVASAWMMAGRIAQLTGAHPAEMKITGLPPSGDGHWLMTGSISEVDGRILASSPVAFPGGESLPALLAPSAGKGAGKGNGGAGSIGGTEPEIGGGLLMQFESPFGIGYTGTIVTAQDPAQLHDAVKKLLEPRVWERLEGDTVSWGGVRGSSVESRNFASSRWMRKQGGGGGEAGSFLSRPWIRFGLGLAGAIVLAILLRGLAERSRNRRVARDPREEQPALEL